ncbi:hypothetical protein G6011_10880 [Alternaria panax]|uniref:Uncharacterized protein n=1 Tax=Alternaria panax TaxID=48097 RepID=A0AAD4ICH1_9PLEO|nr:hypothetical protein G6011_10880 [Alternaria panax]
MTVSANSYPQETFAPLLSLGALFGFRRDTQPTWRYEPPSLQPHVEPRVSPQSVPSLPVAQPDRISSQHAASTTSAFPFGAPYPFSQNTPQTKLQENVGQLGVFTADAQTAEEHFDHFTTKISSAGTLSRAERSQFSHQAWISCRPVGTNAWPYDVMVVKHLTKIHWDPVRILSNLELFHVPPTYTPESLDFLRYLEASGVRLPHASRDHHRLYIKMVRAATSAATSTSLSQDIELLALIRLTLHSCSSSRKAIQGVLDDLCILASKIDASAIKKLLLSELAGINKTKQSIHSLVAGAAQDHTHRALVEEMLLFLPDEEFRSQIPSVTHSLVQAVQRKSWLPTETYWCRLRVWLTILENLDARSDARHPGTGYTSVAFEEVLEHVFKSSSPGVLGPHILVYALVFRMVQQQPAYAKHKESLLQSVHASAVFALEQQHTREIEEDMVMIFSHMRRACLPYEPIVSIAADLFASRANLHSINRFLLALEKHKFLLNRVSSIETRITAEMPLLQRCGDARTLDRRGHHALALQTCQTILDSLKKVAKPGVSSAAVKIREEIVMLRAHRDFTAILDIASTNHALPQVYANLTANITPSQRTILIHQLAHHYSLDATRSHRVTWRFIYTLYTYLQSYSLPIGPLFTKAVVRTAIIRPMMEHRFISARRLIWVCQLVARVEGANVAKQIESVFWRWRGNVIAHAKDVHVAAHGDRKAKAMVGKLKQLDMLGPGEVR